MEFIETPNKRYITVDLWRRYGVETFFPKSFLSFKEARELSRGLGIKNKKEWFKYSKSKKRPNNIPANPRNIYGEWKGWGDFLGTGNTHKKDFLSFEEVREFVRNLGIKNQREWYEYWKSNEKPDNIPYNPSRVYKGKGWINWYDFLGKRKEAA